MLPGTTTIKHWLFFFTNKKNQLLEHFKYLGLFINRGAIQPCLGFGSGFPSKGAYSHLDYQASHHLSHVRNASVSAVTHSSQKWGLSKGPTLLFAVNNSLRSYRFKHRVLLPHDVCHRMFESRGSWRVQGGED